MKTQMMKNLKKKTSLVKVSLFLIALMALTFSCKEEVFDAPTIVLSSNSAMNVAGNDVTTTITIDAPGGAMSLIVLKNGVPQAPVAFSGQTSVTHEFTSMVDQIPIGSDINYTFQAVDNESQTSEPVVFTVTVISKEIVEVSGSITGEVTWTNDKVWRLSGFVRVQDGGVLNINPGTVVIGDRESKGTLIVQMGGQIFAEGTPTEPIVMTSERPVGYREPGDWGGLVLCGRAPNNVTAVTGDPVELEGGYGGWHGGNDPDDNSGVLKYVRIEYAGIPINPNEEVNTLTMGSVGRGTKIDYVMASYGLDDSFEWFGGTVESKYLIAFNGLDDDWDVDLGFSGKVQFGLSLRSPMGADQSGSNGFEVDNNGAGSSDTPFTSAVFANMTVLGPKDNRETPISLQFQHGAQLRRNSRISIYNSVLSGFVWGVYVDDDRPGSGQAFLDDHLQLRNLYLAGVPHWGGNGYGSAGTVFTTAPANGAQHPNNPRGTALKSHANFPGGHQAFADHFNTAAFNNQLFDSYEDLGIAASAFGIVNPNFLPASGSPLLNKTGIWDNTPKADDFFDKVNYIGAFSNVDWTSGWAAYDCHVITYF